MESKRLGTTDVTIGAIGLGGMPMSLSSRPPESQSIQVIHRALDLGVMLGCMIESGLGISAAAQVASSPGSRIAYVVMMSPLVGNASRPLTTMTAEGARIDSPMRPAAPASFRLQADR